MGIETLFMNQINFGSVTERRHNFKAWLLYSYNFPYFSQPTILPFARPYLMSSQLFGSEATLELKSLHNQTQK